MKIIQALNISGSQIFSIILVVLGITTFDVACHCSDHDVKMAIVAAAGALIAGGLAVFQHGPADSNPKIP